MSYSTSLIKKIRELNEVELGPVTYFNLNTCKIFITVFRKYFDDSYCTEDHQERQ